MGINPRIRARSTVVHAFVVRPGHRYNQVSPTKWVRLTWIVTNLPGLPKSLYEKLYCARGQAENLIKAHKLHLASDRTSCHKATANQFRLLIHTAACWLLLTLRRLAPRNSFWRDAQFDTIRLHLIKDAARVTEMVTRIRSP